VALAAVSPFAALYLRNGEVASNGDWITTISYSVVSLAFSLIAFQVFGISSTIPRFLSVKDLMDVAKAVLGSEVMTATALFTVSRLDGIPRSVPAIHALSLGAGLICYRGLANVSDKRRRYADRLRRAISDNVIVIGLNDWSVLIMKYLQSHALEGRRIIALLDEDPRWIGRSVNGVRVLGPPAYLEAAIEEFETHGLRTRWVVVGGSPRELSAKALAEVRGVCAQRDLNLVFLPRLSALGSAEHTCSADKEPDRRTSGDVLPAIRPSPYFRFKRLIDAIIALTLLLTLLPLFVTTTLIVLLDVGWPILFWQQRTGQDGRELQLYKFRTLRPPFDRRCQRIPEERRLSGIGRLLRQTRLDELPQLLNVLVGDMSLIGPRPLLPRDQPPNSAMRLTVRPGISGWAQVNGGILLSPTEKDALDLWYIRNASLWLDLRIIGMTFFGLVKSDRRCEEALAQAMQSHRQQQGSDPARTSRLATADAVQLDEANQLADADVEIFS
jgi:lipopolysaccharide/colanic/teichoic acid biosynthesis glycosyltransferase